MKVQKKDFDRLRAWFAFVASRAFPSDLMRGDANPLASLDALATRSPTKAREGLSMAINDLIEITAACPAEQVASLDLELIGAGLPSLIEMRVQFSKDVKRAVRRGSIKDDVEYHSIRNAAEILSEDQEPLWWLLSEYERNGGAI